MQQVKVGPATFGGTKPLVLIAGPCAIEDEDLTLRIAQRLKQITTNLGCELIFKASYDKANRTSVTSFRGLGMERGLRILQRVKDEFALPVISDVHDVSQLEAAVEVLDILQIPAFLCRQTDLLLAAGETGRAVHVKKGPFLAPSDMAHVAAKIASTGNDAILLCERGTSFGYHRLVNDFRALVTMAETGWPVVFDATHPVQEPGAGNGRSGGERRFVPALARAACAVGVAALFLEVHQDPDNAPSDGPNILPLQALAPLLARLCAIDALAKGESAG